MDQNELTDEQRAALHAHCMTALDELTASLTQVLRAVNRVHKSVARLGAALPGTPSYDGPENEPLGNE